MHRPDLAPGRDEVQTDLPWAQSAIALQANSGPLSHRNTVGKTPRVHLVP